jgi:hypothetical protein
MSSKGKQPWLTVLVVAEAYSLAKEADDADAAAAKVSETIDFPAFSDGNKMICPYSQSETPWVALVFNQKHNELPHLPMLRRQTNRCMGTTPTRMPAPPPRMPAKISNA